MSEPATQAPTPRLKTKYNETIKAQLTEQFGYENVMLGPGLTKIVVNMGVGDAARDSKVIDGAIKDLAAITGQKPQVTRARKSIAQFKLREGMPIGAHVTLRNARMWEFLDRLLSTALPRIRDFRGLSPKHFDGNGNYTFGLTEQSNCLGFRPRKSRMRGSASVSRRSRNSHMRSPRSVTWAPIGMPSRSLNCAIDLRALVTIGF